MSVRRNKIPERLLEAKKNKTPKPKPPRVLDMVAVPVMLLGGEQKGWVSEFVTGLLLTSEKIFKSLNPGFKIEESALDKHRHTNTHRTFF